MLNHLDNPPSSDVSRGLEFHVPHDHLTNMRLRGHAVDIRDARPVAADFSVDVQGFGVVEHKPSLRDIIDVAEHNGRQLEEIADVLRATTGAVKVMCTRCGAALCREFHHA